jgi:hypothetical protein
MDYKPEEDLTNYNYEPESDIDDDVPLAEQFPSSKVQFKAEESEPLVSSTTNVPVVDSFPGEQPAEELKPAPVEDEIPGATKVEGFQLVQATGLTDTSTPAPTGSGIPQYATAAPVPSVPLPHTQVPSHSLHAPLPVPSGISRTESNPLDDNSKAKQFTARTDYMIAEFFARQVARFTRGAPEALDRSYR